MCLDSDVDFDVTESDVTESDSIESDDGNPLDLETDENIVDDVAEEPSELDEMIGIEPSDTEIETLGTEPYDAEGREIETLGTEPYDAEGREIESLGDEVVDDDIDDVPFDEQQEQELNDMFEDTPETTEEIDDLPTDEHDKELNEMLKEAEEQEEPDDDEGWQKVLRK